MSQSITYSPSMVGDKGYRSGVVWQALVRKKASAAASASLLWGVINFVICAVLVACLDSVAGSAVYWWCCVGGCSVCAANIITHIWYYLYPLLLLSPVPVSGTQQKLLSLSNNECSTTRPGDAKTSNTSTGSNESFSAMLQQALHTPPSDLSVTLHNTSALSWASFGSPSSSPQSWRGSASPLNATATWPTISPTWPAIGCEVATDTSNCSLYGAHQLCSMSYNSTGVANNSSLLSSPNSSVAATSWAYLSQFPTSPSSSSPAAGTPPALSTPTRSGGPIKSRRELDAYITQFEKHRSNTSQVLERCSSSGAGGASGGSEGLWCYNSSQQHNISDNTAASTLRRNAYQIATPDPVGSGSGSGTGSGGDAGKDVSSTPGSRTTKLWARRNVSPRQLFQFEENLRIWLCGVVVQPLVKGIDQVNRALADLAPDVQIGVVGVEKLRKACQLTGVRQLSGLVPFLERAPTQQQYLVSRLRQLAQGGALSGYNWCKGGTGWTDQCPTDALLLVELFAMYLDSQLPPDPSQTEGRVFSSQYIVTTPDKPPQQPDHALIHITQLSPPHVRVILPGEDPCEVGEGHKNVLHCLLLFIHHLIHTQHSFIAGVNLALTGVNLAWVVTDSS